ncbi:hypothetical protein GCM10010149_13570 [Nonomuraea roseoviolacea subsp. roseoviolacea]
MATRDGRLPDEDPRVEATRQAVPDCEGFQGSSEIFQQARDDDVARLGAAERPEREEGRATPTQAETQVAAQARPHVEAQAGAHVEAQGESVKRHEPRAGGGEAPRAAETQKAGTGRESPATRAEEGRKPKAGSGERRLVRQVAFAQVALGFMVNSLGACLVLLARDLRTPAGELAWLASSFGAGLLVVGVVGRWALGYGLRRAMLGSALVAAAGAALLATAPVALPAAAGALLLGLGAAGLVLVIPALLRGPDAAAKLTRANAAGSVSALLGPLAIGAFDTPAVNGRLALLLAVPPLLLLASDTLKGGPADDDLRSASAGEEIEGAPTDDRLNSAPASDDLRDTPADAEVGRGGVSRRWRVAGRWGAIVVGVSMEFCFTIWATARLQAAGLPAGASAATATAFLVGMAAGRLVAPRLIARHLPVVPLGCGLAAAGTLAVALADAPLPVAAGLVVAGLGIAPFYPVTLARLLQVPGLAAARSAAYGALASGTAILAAPAVLASLGAALDLRTAYLVTVLPLAAVLAAATLPAWVRHRRRRDAM